MHFTTIFTFAFLLINGVTAIGHKGSGSRLRHPVDTLRSYFYPGNMKMHSGSCSSHEHFKVTAWDTPMTAKDCYNKRQRNRHPCGFFPDNSNPIADQRCWVPELASSVNSKMPGTCYYYEDLIDSKLMLQGYM
ncbi:hypothetical protein AX17_003766 [Amanita inopinata Kibby_2008]|nr:hypothetical protein AX17_003766 [Amanita inopinata Kibby_2008]